MKDNVDDEVDHGMERIDFIQRIHEESLTIIMKLS